MSIFKDTFVDVHTHATEPTEGIVALGNYRLGVDTAPPLIPFAAGIHPWDAVAYAVNPTLAREEKSAAVVLRAAEAEPTAEVLLAGVDERSKGVLPSAEVLLAEVDALEELQKIDCKAIGEIGLDYSPAQLHSKKGLGGGREVKAQQRRLLAKQLAIAQQRRLPVVVHCVKAYDDVLEQLANFQDIPAVIFHGFIGSADLAVRLVKRGYFLSFGYGALRSPKTLRALRVVPKEQILLESDTVTYRPIELLYDGIGAVLDMSKEELKELIYNNYQRIFK